MNNLNKRLIQVPKNEKIPDGQVKLFLIPELNGGDLTLAFSDPSSVIFGMMSWVLEKSTYIK